MILIRIFLCVYIFNFYNYIRAFTPQLRGDHTAVLLNDKIYFNGGNFSLGPQNTSVYASDQLFYLDVSKSFSIDDISLMPWTDLSSVANLANRSQSAACLDGISNTSIYFIAGQIGAGGSFLNVYDTATQRYSTPSDLGSFSTKRTRSNVPCIVLNGRIYLYSGYSGYYYTIMLNTSSLTWTKFSPLLIPPHSQRYTATLLNNSILYIGCGQSDTMQQLAMYSTIDNIWSVINTSGEIPLTRCDHSSVFISQFNQILIFYGSVNTTIDHSIIALNTLTYSWSIPTISNTGGPQPGLHEHTSTLVGTYVLIAFGYNQNGSSTSGIYLLDVSQEDNYKWVTTFNPTTPTPSSSSHSSTSKSSKSSNSSSSSNSLSMSIGAIIGSVIGGIAGLILFTAIIVLAVHFIKNKYPSRVVETL
ncbi:galactose oxidase [Gigaspora margarita]|uniref:Galactose oxidase n=1 Tax=Gigaspora margarita TaxID=4874 RepID=A0A8H4A3Q3_GIGMA|nr:galactose oxidase [Gigaspora margarita]